MTAIAPRSRAFTIAFSGVDDPQKQHSCACNCHIPRYGKNKGLSTRVQKLTMILTAQKISLFNYHKPLLTCKEDEAQKLLLID